MTHRPLILISNDDGIESPGLHAAAEALAPLGDLLIAAPEGQQSAVGRGLRADPGSSFKSRSIDIGGGSQTGWSLIASPATTVRHALQCLCRDRTPDLVVSGINYGENLGTNVTASGTVGAAIQAAIWGIKAIAISLEVDPAFHYRHGDADWTASQSILTRFAATALASRWPDDVHVLKVDIPETAGENTLWRVSRQSMEPGWYGFVPDPKPDSLAGMAEGLAGPRPGKKAVIGDDLDILRRRREVAVTPLSVDMTSRADPGKLAEILGIHAPVSEPEGDMPTA